MLCPLNPKLIQFNNQQGNAEAFQNLGNSETNTSAAYNNHMIL